MQTPGGPPSHVQPTPAAPHAAHLRQRRWSCASASPSAPALSPSTPFGASATSSTACCARVDRSAPGPLRTDRARSTVAGDRPADEEEESAAPEPTRPDPAGDAERLDSIRPRVAPTPTDARPRRPAPTSVRKRVDVDIVNDSRRPCFAPRSSGTPGARPPGVQMTLAVLGLADTSDEFQNELQGRVREWESCADSHNGDWGPAAMALALDAYGAPGYEVRAYKTRAAARLRDAAPRRSTQTNSPVILLAWRGAHTWVMTGFRADADPRVFTDAKVSRAPTSSTRGTRGSRASGAASDPPGTLPGRRRDGAQLPARGSAPRAGIRSATACTSRSSRRRERPATVPAVAAAAGGRRRMPDRPGATASRTSLTDHRRPRSRTGCARMPSGSARGAWSRRRRRPSPANEATHLAERVVRGVQPARQRVGERVERHRQGECGHDGASVSATSSGSELAAAEEDVRRASRRRRTGRRPRAVVRIAIVSEVAGQSIGGSAVPSSSAIGRRQDAGRRASENDDADQADRQDLVVEARS